ncbi:MAG: hypothetical protein JW809_16335, partial [Pirellulales bacterium]|nr:hypothetical protein [Pirellulales bacterium]
ANWLQTGADWWKGDFNGDGTVDDLDLAVLAANWGAGPGGPAVPEPAAVALLVGAVVALPILRRRGR